MMTMSHKVTRNNAEAKDVHANENKNMREGREEGL
jgi:hypothetical protein